MVAVAGIPEMVTGLFGFSSSLQLVKTTAAVNINKKSEVIFFM
jgi:hypothetical protein